MRSHRSAEHWVHLGVLGLLAALALPLACAGRSEQLPDNGGTGAHGGTTSNVSGSGGSRTAGGSSMPGNPGGCAYCDGAGYAVDGAFSDGFGSTGDGSGFGGSHPITGDGSGFTDGFGDGFSDGFGDGAPDVTPGGAGGEVSAGGTPG